MTEMSHVNVLDEEIDLRFDHGRCNCPCPRTLNPLIVRTDERGNKGKLFFGCTRCKYFDWCLPRRAAWSRNGSRITPTFVEESTANSYTGPVVRVERSETKNKETMWLKLVCLLLVLVLFVLTFK
jgi:hypothetical protein